MTNVIQLTDTHIFSDPDCELYGVNTRQSLQRVLQDVKQKITSPDLVIVTGDIVHDEGAAAYQIIDRMMKTLSAPVWYIPGNHDDADLLHQCLPSSPEGGLCSTQLNGWMVLLLDSSKKGRVEGLLSAATLDRTRRWLDDNKQHPIIACVHHHAVKTGSDWMDRIGLENGDELLALLEQYENVKVLLNGHIHQPLAIQHEHLQLLGTPSTCFQFKQGTDSAGIDTQPPAWRHLELNDDGSFTTTLHQLTDYPRPVINEVPQP